MTICCKKGNTVEGQSIGRNLGNKYYTTKSGIIRQQSFVKYQKGGQNLVDSSGFQYRINKMETAKNKAYWKCISFNATKCPVSLLTVPSTNTLVKMSGEHNHSNMNIKRRVKEVINEAISSAAILPTVAPWTVLGSIAVN